MKTKKRTYNIQRIKRNFSYTIEEIGKLFGIHMNTVHQWSKAGLPFVDSGRPSLIHGTDLISFLKKRQAKRKQTCKTDELFCFKCQAPMKPWEQAVDLKILNQKQLNIIGICPVCSTKLYKAGAVKRIVEYKEYFNVLQMVDAHIIESVGTSMNCNLMKEDER